MGYGVLCVEGTENIFTACEDREAGYIDGRRVFS